MTDEEKLDLAVDWIRSQGWNEETLPSDEFLQMKKAFLAGLDAGKDMAEADLATVAYMQGAESQKKKSEKQLAKAMEIIKHFVDRCKMCIAYPEAYNMWYREIDDAEQFLKEVSE